MAIGSMRSRAFVVFAAWAASLNGCGSAPGEDGEVATGTTSEAMASTSLATTCKRGLGTHDATIRDMLSTAKNPNARSLAVTVSTADAVTNPKAWAQRSAREFIVAHPGWTFSPDQEALLSDAFFFAFTDAAGHPTATLRVIDTPGSDWKNCVDVTGGPLPAGADLFFVQIPSVAYMRAAPGRFAGGIKTAFDRSSAVPIEVWPIPGDPRMFLGFDPQKSSLLGW